jgi:hypothetical protein
MTISVLQQDTPAFNNSAVSSLTGNPLPSAATTGNVLIAWCGCAYTTNEGNEISSVTDSGGNTYSLVGVTLDFTDNTQIAAYICTNNQHGTRLAATVSYGTNTPTFNNITLWEIAGAKNQAADVANFPVRIVTPGTGTNAIQIAVANTNTPGLICGYISAVEGSENLSAGTGFTAKGGFSSSSFSGLFVVQRVTGTGTACAWTDSTDGAASTYLGGAFFLDEAASTGGGKLLLLGANNGGF